LCWQFGFVSFWRKIIGAKAARKMLMKLTPERVFFLPVLDCLPLKGESGVEPLRTFRRGGATGALKVAASPLGGNGGRKGAGCSVIAYIFKRGIFIT